MPKKSKGIVMYLAMFGLLIVLLFAMMSLDKPVSTLKYYQVLDYFKQGEVAEYQIDYNSRTLTLRLEGKDQLVDYQLASIPQFNEDIKPYRITPACAGKRLKKAHKIKDFDPVPIRFHLVFRRFERWCSNLPTPDGNVPV